MEIKFQPQEMNLKFEVFVLLFFGLIFIVYQAPMFVESYRYNKIPISLDLIYKVTIVPPAFVLFNLFFFPYFKKKTCVERNINYCIRNHYFRCQFYLF